MATKAYALIFSIVVLSMAAMGNALAPVEPLPVGPLLKFRVQGTIFCLSGKRVTPILRATTQARCVALGRRGMTRQFVVVSSPTDRNGVYFISFPSILLTGEKLLHCKVLLNVSPLARCNIALNINNGITGSALKLKNSRPLDAHTILLIAKPLFFSNGL